MGPQVVQGCEVESFDSKLNTVSNMVYTLITKDLHLHFKTLFSPSRGKLST